MPNPVVHWEIMGQDGKMLQEFYAEAFGWHIDSNNEWNYGIADTRTEQGINGGVGGGHGPTRVTIYVEVDDLQAYLDRVERLGGKTLMSPSDLPGGLAIAMFSDPEGNVVGLSKGM